MSIRKLIVLGTSSQQPTRYRNHGAYLFLWNDEGLLFDPGEGTQRQFIFANVSPTHVTRIFISHFHGDHCLGVGSMLMRLNLDKVTHPIHCYFPADKKEYFDKLRFSTIYHETIHVVEHPIEKPGLVHEDATFKVYADFLSHGTTCLGYRVEEHDRVKFDKQKLKEHNIKGPNVRALEEEKMLQLGGKTIKLEDVTWVQKGKSIAVILDTASNPKAVLLAKDVDLLLCESTYTQEHKDLAKKYLHLTAQDAATLAKSAQAKKLVLTHFSARYREASVFEIEARKTFKESFAAEDLKEFGF
ncbi:MAG: Ribonuclease BN [Chlamydiae bacterium]|nr:Ribonuclease BN [Chlamydiota bacterium]